MQKTTTIENSIHTHARANFVPDRRYLCLNTIKERSAWAPGMSGYTELAYAQNRSFPFSDSLVQIDPYGCIGRLLALMDESPYDCGTVDLEL